MARSARRSILSGFPETELVRTLVWELPLRIAHWTLFGAVVVLVATGAYIHRPFAQPGNLSFLLAWIRFTHIVAGSVLIGALALRFYWLFRGNFWSRWTALVPIHPYQWRDLWATAEFYLFLRFRPKPRLGHNALAALSYLAIYLLFVVEVLTGLALLVHIVHTPAMNELLGWLPPLVPIEWTRAVHSFLTWIFVAFTLFHVYLTTLVSTEEKNGLVDSMFSGYKFVPAAELRAEVTTIPEARTYVKRPVALPSTPTPGKAPKAAAPGPALLFRNWVSYAGAAIAAAGAFVFAILFLYHTVGGGYVRTPYGDLVVFMGVPIVVALGIAVLLLGMYLQWLRWRRHKPLWYPRYPRWDLNLPADRRALLALALGGAVALGLLAYTGVGAYVYTDSNQFCASVCHTMEPERVTHQLSAHARVECAGCHVGAGTRAYVVAKTNGMQELWANLTDTYPRPIPSPVRVLRPIRESCERCHWPWNRFGGTLRRRVHFLSDERNTRWEIDVLVPVGGGRAQDPEPHGVHWHVIGKVEYVASDARREHIPWIRATDPRTGAATVYTSSEEPPPGRPSEREGSIQAPLELSCIDCHSRPAHVLLPPTAVVDRALALGEIDAGLPWIRREAVRALATRYETREAAHRGIEGSIRAFYREARPEVLEKSGAALAASIAAVVRGYDRHFFPAMNARWDAYPAHAGHLIGRGCFRCHDGKHRSADREQVSWGCNACHLIVRQGTPGRMERSAAPGGLTFEHPVDVGTAWAETPCSDCHTGGPQ